VAFKFKAPNTYLIISSIIVLMAILTWIIPAGEFQRSEINGRNVVVPGSYQQVDSNPQGPVAVLKSPVEGFIDPLDGFVPEIIIFILIVGGAFEIFKRTGAVNAAINSVVRAQEKSEVLRLMLIPLFMIIFSLGGATFGMSEETIPFVLVFIPLALALGYDSIVGAAIPFVGAGAGFAGAFLNPFTVQIAQGLAEVELVSGWEYRLLCWFVITTIAIGFVMRYASRIKKNPQLSPVYDSDQKKRLATVENDFLETAGEKFSTKNYLVLGTFFVFMIALVIGVVQFGWYIKEIAALFLLMGIVMGLVGGLGADGITSGFIDGAKDLLGTALIIALAKGIIIIASEGRIIDTMLYSLSNLVGDMHPILASQTMFGVQSAINFFVPSGSGQAALTMPLMAPLADLLGVSRQTAVLSYQLGDGFSNLIIPTSAILMGVLSLADVRWETWAKWILPLQIIFVIVGLLLLIPPYFMGWQ